MSDSAIRPVLSLERALEELDREHRAAARGPLRRRAFNAKNALPAGAIDRAAMARLALRWERHFEADFPPPEATSAPPAAVGTTYWLSSGDEHGAVLRVRLERLPPRRAPFVELWPGAIEEGSAALDAAEKVYQRVARVARFSPSEPLRGWHRIVPAEVEAHEWRALRIEGRSFGAALALMLLSTWLDAPLDSTIAVTGDLDDALRLTLPAGSRNAVAAKVRAAKRERACIRRVLVPKGLAPDVESDGPEVIEVDGLDDLVRHFGLRLDRLAPPPFSIAAWLGAVEEADWLVRTRATDIPLMRARLERLDSALGDVWSTDDRSKQARPFAIDAALFRVLGRLCGFASHDVDRDAAIAESARIDQLVEEVHAAGRVLPLASVAQVRNAQASALIDVNRFASARRYAAESLRAANEARDEVEAARIMGTVARIEAHARDDERALRLFDRALAANLDCIPWEANIGRAYRISTLGRLGRSDDAREALREAREETQQARGMSEGWRTDNALYLDYEDLKLSLALGDLEATRRALATCEGELDARSRGPWPALGVYVRGIDACLRWDDRRGAEARFERLLRRAGSDEVRFATLIGRGAAHLVLDDLAREATPDPGLIERVRAYIARIPDGEESPFTAPRDACRRAIDHASLAALIAVEIY
jgi:hypothetical protein